MTQQEKFARKNENRKAYDKNSTMHREARELRQRIVGFSSNGNLTFGAFGIKSRDEFNELALGTTGNRG